MSHQKVYETVTSCDIPCRHIEWGQDEEPSHLPWALYLGEEHPFCADDGVWAVRFDWTVELYEEHRDAALERKLWAAIAAAFGPPSKKETRLKSEGMLMVTYDFSEIEVLEQKPREGYENG